MCIKIKQFCVDSPLNLYCVDIFKDTSLGNVLQSACLLKNEQTERNELKWRLLYELFSERSALPYNYHYACLWRHPPGKNNNQKTFLNVYQPPSQTNSSQFQTHLLLSDIYIVVYRCLSKLDPPSPIALNEKSKKGRVLFPLPQSLVILNGYSFFSGGCCNISFTLII